MAKTLLAFLLITSSIHCFPQSDSTSIQKGFFHFGNAYRALQKKEFNTYYLHLRKVRAQLPHHPGILYNLAQASFLSNRKSEAMLYLTQLANMKLFYDINTDTIFSNHPASELDELLKKFESNRKPLVKSERAHHVDELNLAAEGLAYDSKTQSFFISSIYKSKIIRIDTQGKATDFSLTADSLLGIYGLHVDEKNRKLWACNIAVPQMLDHPARVSKRSFLCALNLDNGKLIDMISLPEGKSQIKDVTVAPDGTVYFSDMAQNIIYKYSPGTKAATPLTKPGVIGNSLGLDISSDGKSLFVADFLQGIFKLNTATGELILLSTPTDHTLQGIDGLYYYKGSLVAVQNGLHIPRIIQCTLNKKQDGIETVRVLESNHPDYSWPTLGVVVKNSFYYVANSQWTNFSNNGKVIDQTKSTPTYVLKLRLD